MESAQKPLAYYYELSTYKTSDGKYVNFAMCLSFEKPNVPEESIRNLKPLFTKEQFDALSK